jgi:hypothetical protein
VYHICSELQLRINVDRVQPEFSVMAKWEALPPGFLTQRRHRPLVVPDCLVVLAAELTLTSPLAVARQDVVAIATFRF